MIKCMQGSRSEIREETVSVYLQKYIISDKIFVDEKYESIFNW